VVMNLVVMQNFVLNAENLFVVIIEDEGTEEEMMTMKAEC